MTAAKTLLAVPSAIVALACVAPSPALAITGYAGAPTAVAAQYPASANSQTPPSAQAPSLTPSPGTPVSSNSETPGSSPSQSPGTESTTGGPTQPQRQFVASAGPAGTLPFTGYAAIAAIAAGLALLLGGLAVRRAGRVA